jgi:hypothetical protein
MAKPNIFIGTQTQQFLRGCGLCFGNLPFEMDNFDLDAILLPSYMNCPNRDTNSRQFFQSCNYLKISSWTQGISMPSLVKIDLTILD